ncbi:PREDICTED: cyclic AMP receptor 2-like [Amphimedon queenslandica]|nr:PREDICTED: cyclic AMP receptor 2-like [Amphimedon queenslandica]|eukprot:XP_011404082.1 PREDICTED: cyclic AMP receptor 2-like [Amphimedon queenslandica]
MSGDCPNGSDLTSEEKRIILSVYGGEGILSATVCLTALLMIIKLKYYKDTVQRLLLWQLIAGLGLSLYNMLNLLFINYDEETSSRAYTVLCSIVGYIGTVTFFVKIAFTLWLTIFLFRCLVCLKDPKELSKMEILYVSTSLGLPLLVSLVPFIHHSYGIAGAWCWIKEWKDDCASDEKLVLGVIFEDAFYSSGAVIALTNAVLITITLSTVLCRIRCSCVGSSSSEKEQLLETVQLKHKNLLKKLLPLIAYPLVFLFLIIFPLTNRIYGGIGKRISFPLFMLHAAVEPFWGLFVGVAIIVHIAVIEYKKKTKKIHFKVPVVTGVQSMRRYNALSPVDDAYTVDTVAATSAKTTFEPSTESIDNCSCTDDNINGSIVSTDVYK